MWFFFKQLYRNKTFVYSNWFMVAVSPRNIKFFLKEIICRRCCGLFYVSGIISYVLWVLEETKVMFYTYQPAETELATLLWLQCLCRVCITMTVSCSVKIADGGQGKFDVSTETSNSVCKPPWWTAEYNFLIMIDVSGCYSEFLLNLPHR